MKEEGVCGGSMFGATFFHDSTKVESIVDGSSVEKARAVTDLEDAAVADREMRREACLNMAAIWSLGEYLQMRREREKKTKKKQNQKKEREREKSEEGDWVSDAHRLLCR